MVIDADALAREVVAPGSDGLAAIVEEFGPQVLTASGTLDRAALARLVFTDEERLAQLNAITHPRIAARREAIMAGLPSDAVVVDDIPLLAEARSPTGRPWDVILVVDAPDDVRLRRLVGRGMTPEDAQVRMARQATREQRLSIADIVIDNAGDEQQLRDRVEHIWHTRIAARAPIDD